MERFIEAVRLEQCLWNPLHPDYRDTHIKDDAWHRVIEFYKDSTISNIQTAKQEWKKLRDNHRDALKRAKLGKNKLLPATITTWKYAKAMQFLEPHMKYRVTENIEIEPLNAETSSFKPSDHGDVSTTETTEIKIENPPPKKRRFFNVPMNVSNAKIRGSSDALESFFNCILKSTREMPPWMQTQVKKKIFAVIIDAEEQLSVQEEHTPFSHYGSHIPVETQIKEEVVNEDSYDSYNDSYS